jgi:hypothetical protein
MSAEGGRSATMGVRVLPALGRRRRLVGSALALVGLLVVVAPRAGDSPEARDSPGTCLGPNEFGYEGGLAALEAVRVLRHTWLAGDQPGVDRCVATGVDIDELIGPAPRSEDTGPMSTGPGDGSSANVTFTNEPAVEVDPETGVPSARVAVTWAGRYIEFTVSLVGEPQVVGAAEFAPPVEFEASAEVLRQYLIQLANGDYRAAARALGVGDTPFERRPDLHDLGVSGTSITTLAEALTAYCASDCPPPETIFNAGLDRRRGFLLRARFADGSWHDFLVWGSGAGIPYVRGLPPPGG